MCLQERPEERWRPILGVEAVLLSVLSLLSDPNDSSPANIDAGVRAEVGHVSLRPIDRSIAFRV